MEHLSAPPSRRNAWYVLHCRAQREWQVASMLDQRLGLQVYLPELQYRFRGQNQYAPLFPGYLFVHVDLQLVGLNSINTLPGVVRLVAFGETPESVPDCTIAMLREYTERMNSSGELIGHGYRPGDTVKIKDGPFDGLEAIFYGPTKPSERVRVLLEFLGSSRQVDVRVDALEPAQPMLQPYRQRRTRGGGRAIKSRSAPFLPSE